MPVLIYEAISGAVKSETMAQALRSDMGFDTILKNRMFYFGLGIPNGSYVT